MSLIWVEQSYPDSTNILFDPGYIGGFGEICLCSILAQQVEIPASWDISERVLKTGKRAATVRHRAKRRKRGNDGRNRLVRAGGEERATTCVYENELILERREGGTGAGETTGTPATKTASSTFTITTTRWEARWSSRMKAEQPPKNTNTEATGRSSGETEKPAAFCTTEHTES